MRATSLLLGCVLVVLPSVERLDAKETPRQLSAARIRQILIEESIADYAGSCPCPYSTARNGSRCGRRSAYSRAGGADVLCYPKDVSDALVQQYRAAHAED